MILLKKNKVSFLLAISLLAISYCNPCHSQSLNENPAGLIFPTIPNRLIPDINTLEEKPQNIIFKNSDFTFILPEKSKVYKSIVSNTNNALEVKIKDSKDLELVLEHEILTFTTSTKSIVKIINIKNLPETISEGNATLSLSSNGESETDAVYISKTLSEKLTLDDLLKTTINSTSIINKPIIGTNLRLLRVLVGGKNFYNKKLSINNKILTESKGFTKAVLIPQDSFSNFSSRILKGNEILITKATFINSKKNNEALLFIITPFGTFTEKISIPACIKACGEN